MERQFVPSVREWKIALDGFETPDPPGYKLNGCWKSKVWFQIKSSIRRHPGGASSFEELVLKSLLQHV
jgi:hypothetical protein